MSKTPHLMFVHAHPDDETITSGATMAKYVAAGYGVTLITCTAGEEGEVVVPDLAHVSSANEDRLGQVRREELAAAMAELGVKDHRFLGGFGRFRDSGMMGTDQNNHPGCFWRADLLEAATELVRVIREVRPDVLVTYDDFGGYGHPDHIQTHRVATYAVALAASPTFDLGSAPHWDVPKVYWTAMPKGAMQAAADALKAQGVDNEFTSMSFDDVPFACDDDLVTTTVDAGDFHEHKTAALRAHRTQIEFSTGFFQMLGAVDKRMFAQEHYRLAKGTLGELDASGRERDLLA